jgi:UDPglucose 6-dehydrogenase
MKIAIIGHGFVGQAVEYGYNGVDIMIIDPKYPNGSHYDDDVPAPEFAFICVPTPMSTGGSIDTAPIEDALWRVRDRWQGITVIIKSTVTPKTIVKIQRLFPNLNIVYNPEFLREASSKNDFTNPEFHVFGGDAESTQRVQRLYETHSNCRPCPTFHMTLVEASFTKYMVNSYLATKVSFFNEFNFAMAEWPEDTRPNFNAVVKAVGSDSRIGHSHTSVPGHDGKMGYGGACFPKDVGAIINSEVLPLLSQVQARNNDIRAAAGMTDREVAQNVHFTFRK